MNTRRALRGVAAFGLVGVGAVGLGVSGAAAPAQAFTGTCPTTVPAATLVADNVCEIRITAPGATTFTPPSGITKLSAVLVGGGGGALIATDEYYAGSGGAVVYIDSVPTGAAFDVTVGAGGDPGNGTGQTFIEPTNGGDTALVAATTTTAEGGLNGDSGGVPSCGINASFVLSGDGAQTSADPDCVPGVGFSLAQLSGLDAALFPAASLGPEVYGDGGTGSVTDPVAPGTVAGTGGSVNNTVAEGGTAGLVILRFAPVAPVAPVTPAAPAGPRLPATGVDVSWTVPALSAVVIAAGALLLVRRRRAEGAAGR